MKKPQLASLRVYHQGNIQGTRKKVIANKVIPIGQEYAPTRMGMVPSDDPALRIQLFEIPRDPIPRIVGEGKAPW